jgi:hypothetical protein
MLEFTGSDHDVPFHVRQASSCVIVRWPGAALVLYFYGKSDGKFLSPAAGFLSHWASL